MDDELSLGFGAQQSLDRWQLFSVRPPPSPLIIPNDQEGWAVPSALSRMGCGGPASRLLCLTPDNCSPTPRPGLIRAESNFLPPKSHFLPNSS